MIFQTIYLRELSGEFSDLPLSQKQTKAGRFLLAGMVKERYGKTDYTVTYNENGKPLLDFCFFSISHSSELVACAVGEEPVGIDVEKIKPVKQRKTYPLFSETESRYVNESEDSSLAFLTLWTRKEACVKAIGGKMSDMAGIVLAREDLSLKPRYKSFILKTEEKDGYLISTAVSAGK